MLTDEAASQLIHAFITSRIDYCNSILYGMPDTILSDLHRIQNTASRILTKQRDRNCSIVLIGVKPTFVTSYSESHNTILF